MDDLLNSLQKQAVKELNLKKIEEIYRGHYYTKEHQRNLILSCKFENKDAVLKVYADPRDTDEGQALSWFHSHNESKIITAPQLFAYKQLDPKTGWILMEKLPLGTFFEQPLISSKIDQFLELFLEYRHHFPKLGPKPFPLDQKVPPDIFHLHRIAHWFRLAASQEKSLILNKKPPLLHPKHFVSLYQKALQIIEVEFKNRKMLYCHGHFKPHEVYQAQSGKFYLIDFAHAKMYPEGYELAFIIWADYLMSANWHKTYEKWSAGVFEWQEHMLKIAQKLKIKHPKNS